MPKRAMFAAGATTCDQRRRPYLACRAENPRTLPGTALGRAAVGGTVPGATARKCRALVVSVSMSSTTQTPPPPRLAEDGLVTARAK